MNSRQRILAAIDHHEPDCLPVDLGSTPSSGISAIAYNNLINYLQLKDRRKRVYDVVQQVAQPSDEFLDTFRIDVLDLGRTFNTRDEDWQDYTLAPGQAAPGQAAPGQAANGHTAQQPRWFNPVKQPDGSYLAYQDGIPIAKMPLGATFYDQTIFPFLDGYPADIDGALDQAMRQVHWAALAHSPWDHAGEADFYQQLRQHALELRASSERAIMVVAGCNLFEWGTFLRRIDNFLMDLVLDPANVERLLDALLERHLKTLENVCAAVGDIADVLRMGDDLGMDTGLFMQPSLYRKLFKPRHAQLCAYVHQHSQMRTFLHSCGSLYPILPDLIEAGYEVLNPVQINARQMEPDRLKREFGKDITFWGAGADTRHVLNRAQPEEVKAHVRRNIEILAPGGGFVFNTVHNILPDVPPENIVAMFEAVDEYR